MYEAKTYGDLSLMEQDKFRQRQIGNVELSGKFTKVAFIKILKKILNVEWSIGHHLIV